MSAALECRGVSKVYGVGALAETALRDVSLSVAAGQTCVLLGPSGSGKTTMLSILGCLLSPTAGEVWVGGERVRYGSPGQLAALRRRQIGFVFQHAQLLPFLSMEENIRLVGRNAGLGERELAARVDDLLARLDVEGLRGRPPAQASGGQRQRVAIARALLHRPAVLLADEPTAALDWEHGEAVVRLLTEQARREKAVLLTVTHDTRLIPLFERVFLLDGGRLREQ
jgi:putative ABC transport system ATP-binding protein